MLLRRPVFVGVDKDGAEVCAIRPRRHALRRVTTGVGWTVPPWADAARSSRSTWSVASTERFIPRAPQLRQSAIMQMSIVDGAVGRSTSWSTNCNAPVPHVRSRSPVRRADAQSASHHYDSDPTTDQNAISSYEQEGGGAVASVGG
jgi:hypothetical protein